MSSPKTMPSIKSLKLTAKKLASTKNIHLSQALDLVANDYGFTHWTLMLKYFNSVNIDNIESIWLSFLPGEMLLLSAPEGAGKLSLALNLATHALRLKLPVKYYSMHFNKSFLFDRLNKIVEPSLISEWQQRQYIEIEEKCINQMSLIEKIKKDKKNALLIIDYLQAITSHEENDSYHEFLHEIKLITQQHNLRTLILSQVNKEISFESMDYVVGGRSISRHFSHVIHMEYQEKENKDERDIALVKSIHYQKQKSLLQFNKNNYRFV